VRTETHKGTDVLLETRPLSEHGGCSKTRAAEATTSNIHIVSATSKCRIWSQTGASSNTFSIPIPISVNRRMIRAVEARDGHIRHDAFLSTTQITYIPAMTARTGWSSRKCKRAGLSEVKSCNTDTRSDVAGKSVSPRAAAVPVIPMASTASKPTTTALTSMRFWINVKFALPL
jgi:hypothetical protein